MPIIRPVGSCHARLRVTLAGLMVAGVILSPARGFTMPIDGNVSDAFADAAGKWSDRRQEAPTLRGTSARQSMDAHSTLAADKLDLFFANVFKVQSGIRLSCQGCAEPISPSPEPAALLLFGATLAGIGLLIRRKLRRSDPGIKTAP